MRKILVIDDEADMRFAVRMLLERSGHSVVEADNGDAALTKIDEGAPDLVLLDMRLPGMDGIQILQKIREKHERSSRSSWSPVTAMWSWPSRRYSWAPITISPNPFTIKS